MSDRKKKSAKICKKEGKLYNSKTNRCIQDTNANRRKLGLPEKASKNSPKKSPKRTSTKKTEEECEAEGKILNPKTGRCVQNTKANRRRLGIEEEPEDNPQVSEDVSPPRRNRKVPKTKEECEAEGKILNPKTGNCIKNTKANRKKYNLRSPSRISSPKTPPSPGSPPSVRIPSPRPDPPVPLRRRSNIRSASPTNNNRPRPNRRSAGNEEMELRDGVLVPLPKTPPSSGSPRKTPRKTPSPKTPNSGFTPGSVTDAGGFWYD